MGTSTCHVVNSGRLAEVPGMCGVVDGGIIAGACGYEAGQSAVGDIFAWYAGYRFPAEHRPRPADAGESIHDLLTGAAAQQPVGAHGLVALDWTAATGPLLVDHELSRPRRRADPGDPARGGLPRAARGDRLLGTRMIVETFEQAGIPVTELIVAGGLRPTRLLMQIYADVTRRPPRHRRSAQGPALGSAIHAAVAAGGYPDVAAAAAVMGRVDA